MAPCAPLPPTATGTGLGQSTTYFRGFPDAATTTSSFDSIPFYDTNTPTHHSWAFFHLTSTARPGIDFDRSPGTGLHHWAHALRRLHPPALERPLARAEYSRRLLLRLLGHVVLYDGEYDSGSIRRTATRPASESTSSTWIPKGYQTNNFQNRNAGSIKVSTSSPTRPSSPASPASIWLDANTPNFSATRCQMYGAPTDGSLHLHRRQRSLCRFRPELPAYQQLRSLSSIPSTSCTTTTTSPPTSST